MIDLLWHYTKGFHMPAILRSRAIHVATTFVPPHQRPIVWFSANQHWEATAAMGAKQPDGTYRTMTFEEMRDECPGGLVRIGVTRSVAPHDWQDLQRKGRIRPREARALERGAREDGGNPSEWFGTFAPVPWDEWSAVEVYRDGRWVRTWTAGEAYITTKVA